MNIPKYSYGLFLLLGVYLLYDESSSVAMVGLLGFMIVIALLSFVIDVLAHHSWFRLWLEKIF